MVLIRFVIRCSLAFISFFFVVVVVVGHVAMILKIGDAYQVFGSVFSLCSFCCYYWGADIVGHATMTLSEY